MSGMKEWAEDEVKLYYDRHMNDDKDFNYMGECARSALKAYKSLLEDGHSGMSICITKMLLNRLIDGKPLTPIVDIPENWNRVGGWDDYEKVYQCKRMSSLFKKVKKDGTIIFSDNDRVKCKDLDRGSTYSSGMVNKIINKMYPITFPYMPNDVYIMYTKEFLSDPKEGDFDHKALIALTKNGDIVTSWKPKYYDLRGDDDTPPKEISQVEFYRREAEAEKREKENKNG